MCTKKITLIFPKRKDTISTVFNNFWLTNKVKNLLHFGKTNFTPPLSLLMLAAVTPPEFKLNIIDERLEEINFDIDVDLVGISTVTRTAFYVYDIADRFREKGVKVVLGGIHPSVLPEEALLHADAVVIGEGELVWPQLLEDFKQNALKKIYKAFKSVCLDNLPLPRRDLLKFPGDYLTTKAVSATRGCPYHCTYCSIGATLGREYRMRPVEQVIEELESVKGNLLVFFDDNLGADIAYAKRLFSAIIPLRLRWFGCISMDALEDDQLVKLIAESGCALMSVGLESISRETLKQMGKLETNKPERYTFIIKKLHDNGIAVAANFILGFDSDPPDIYERLGHFIEENCIEVPNINTLIPYPGTPVYRQLERENRILHKNWDLYDNAGASIVYKPLNMSPEELVKKYLTLTGRVFSYRSTLLRLTKAGYFKPFLFALALHYNIQKKRSTMVELENVKPPVI